MHSRMSGVPAITDRPPPAIKLQLRMIFRDDSIGRKILQRGIARGILRRYPLRKLGRWTKRLTISREIRFRERHFTLVADFRVCQHSFKRRMIRIRLRDRRASHFKRSQHFGNVRRQSLTLVSLALPIDLQVLLQITSKVRGRRGRKDAKVIGQRCIQHFDRRGNPFRL